MKNISEAYLSAVTQVLIRGVQGVTEDGEDVITSPIPIVETFSAVGPEDSFWIPPGLGHLALKQYAQQLFDGDKGGFDYTYGNRIRTYFGTDQLQDCIRKLISSPDTRRAIITTNDPRNDCLMVNRPCMQYIQFYRNTDGKLNAFVLFRSHDVLSAWFANMYAVSQLLHHVSDTTNIPIGTVTCCSVIPHIYYKRDASIMNELRESLDYRAMVRICQLTSQKQ